MALNDSFASAIALSGPLPISRTGDDNIGAGIEDGEPVLINYGEADPGEEYAGIGSTVWYSWVPAADGLYSARIDTDFDSVLTVYAGASLAGLVRLGQSDAVWEAPYGETVYFPAEAGETYWIQAAGYNGAEGSIDVTLAAAQKPSNDDFAAAQALVMSEGEAPVRLELISEERANTSYRSSFFPPGTPKYAPSGGWLFYAIAEPPYAVTVEGTNAGAGSEEGEPQIDGSYYGIVKTVWYRWDSPAYTSWAHAEMATAINQILAVWTGDAVDGLTQVVGWGSSADFEAAPDTSYYVQVGGQPGYGPDEGPFDLTMSAYKWNEFYLVPEEGGSPSPGGSGTWEVTIAGHEDDN